MKILSFSNFCIATVFAVLGYYIGTSPLGVSPPLPLPSALPPWPAFRIGIAVADVFASALTAVTPPAPYVKTLVTSYWQSEVAYALTKNGVFDQFDYSDQSQDQGKSCYDIAKTLRLNGSYLCRYMAAAATLGLLSKDERDPFIFHITSAGQLLHKDHPGSLSSFAMMINEETRDAWRSAATTSLKSGVSGFEEYFNTTIWEYLHNHPESQELFDSAMLSLSAEQLNAILSDWKPQSDTMTFCDVGGGYGHILLNVLNHYPNATGIVFDQPGTARGAAELIKQQEESVASRASAVGGNFFESFPSALASCDVFYMKFIIHDWEDESCITIIKNIKEIAQKRKRSGEPPVILTTDFILDEDGHQFERSKRLMDVNMLSSCPAGARERTFAEYKKLFSEAGVHAEPKLIKLRELVSVVQVSLE